MQNDKKSLLGARLLRVAEFIRYGAVLCDVGTDHAKLPIYLAYAGRIERAYATDINRGPIDSANKNISDFGLSDKIKCILTDGLEGTDGLGVTDISICGMGGELIAGILERCAYIKDERLNLILQPMTHPQDLRRYLYDNGFEIYDEDLTEESGKLYVIICAKYTGKITEYSEGELYLGKILLKKERNKHFFDMCGRVLSHLENRQRSSDEDERAQAQKLYCEIKEMLL